MEIHKSPPNFSPNKMIFLKRQQQHYVQTENLQALHSTAAIPYHLISYFNHTSRLNALHIP